MKNFIISITVAAISFFQNGYAQNVGIGTPSPASKLEITHNGASTYGTALLINQNVVGNADGPKIQFKKTMTSPKSWTTGILNGVDIGTFGISEDGGTGGYGTPRFTIAQGGNVGIGTAAQDASAKLDVTSTTGGFLPPRMNSTQRDAIITPSEGLIIYNTTSKALEFYNGTSWFATTHYIGESYGGGIVFYVYENGQHGLIAATADQSTAIQWYNGSNTYTNAIRDGIEAKSYNTERIIANQGTGNYAAMECAKYNGGGYGDWYLPSKYELNLMYLQKNVVGGFTNLIYWSSSENANLFAWGQFFSNGSQVSVNKSSPYYVRAVRAF